MEKIAYIFLYISLLIFVIYFTKVTSNSYKLCDGLRRRGAYGRDIWDYRVSEDYRKMFKEPSVWQGYQSFDPNEKPQKIYV